MKFISCPHCGQVARTKGNAVICPTCGVVPLLEDSQMISISGGEMGGPGISNLQEQQQEMVIQQGVAQEIPDGKLTVKTFEVPDGTVEEQSVFEWQGSKDKRQSKATVPVTKTQRKNQTHRDGRQKARNVPKTFRRNEPGEKKKVQRNAKRMPKGYPVHYKYLFYGVPGFLLVVLLLLTVWKVVYSKDLNKMWKQAEVSYEKAEIYYNKAQKKKSNKKQYAQILKKAIDQYKNALSKGNEVLESQIDILMKDKELKKKSAEKRAKQDYAKYYMTMNKWRKKLKKVERMLTDAK